MTALKAHPTVYNIAAGYSFADTLAEGLLQRVAANPTQLADYTILLPSRRACRTLREAFLRLSQGKALLLPVMRPIGDVDADEVSFFSAAQGEGADDILTAINPLERQLLLAQLIQKMDPDQSFDQAAALGLELGRFLDEVQTEKLVFADLEKIVPAEFAGHWQQTLDFLKILTEHWPHILTARGVIDFAARRNQLLAAQVKLWQHNPPQKPIIAAGSTGTVPAAAELLALVAHLPQGELVLPGYDPDLDVDSLKDLTPEHPQFNLNKLITRVGVAAENIKSWPVKTSKKINQQRVRLINEAMRPPNTSEQWRALTADDIGSAALEGLIRIDCATPQSEADMIALLMREVLETPEKTCALITPDRRLARRVAMSLKRYNIDIDDSGGQPLTELPLGSFLLLVAEMAEENLAPVTLLSFLKHPLCAAALSPDEHRNMIYTLDELVLRGPRPSGGFQGLRDAINTLPDQKLATRQLLLTWLDKIEELTASLLQMMTATTPIAFGQLLNLHIAAAEGLAATVDKTGAARLWFGEGGGVASDFLSELLRVADHIPALMPEHYIALFGMLLKTKTVRSLYGAHPRLSILGQVEARLYSADVVILGGLNEGTWPALPQHDPWMSRPMRQQFGLPLPEKAICLSAHDFVQAASAPEVFLTRAEKIDGTPTVPARWLLRMDTVLKAVGLRWREEEAEKYRQWARKLDQPRVIKAVQRPAPKPPVAARPRKLSVTKIETWMRDPYQIYARYILGLNKLDPLDDDAGAAERGTFIHAALENFVKKYPDALPPHAEQELVRLGREALDAMCVPLEVEAFWWPRFLRIAPEFIIQERTWRENAKPIATEITGEASLLTTGGDFTLHGKADRIDLLDDKTYAIIDYKSATAPSPKDIEAGVSPQLALEGWILQQDGFANIDKAKTGDLLYWKVTGGAVKPVEQRSIATKKQNVEQLVQAAGQGLQDLIETFDQAETPYHSQPRPQHRPRYSDYDHLARSKEWGIDADDEGGADE